MQFLSYEVTTNMTIEFDVIADSVVDGLMRDVVI